MKMKFVAGSILSACMMVLVLLSAPGAKAEAEYKWKFQSFWQAGSVNHRVYERFGKNLEVMSGGRIQVEVLPVGAIVPPGEMLEAVGKNILQGMNGGTAYFTGKDPAFGMLVDLNGAVWDDPQQYEMWFRHGGGLELARELYGKFGAYYIEPVMWGMESIPTKKLITNVEGFKGVKMRAPEGMNAELWRRVGVGVSSLPGTEVYSALETGKLDATDWGTLGMNDELGFEKVAKYAIYPGLHSMPSSDVSLNTKLWKSLPEDIKAIVATAARDMARDSLETNRLLDLSMVAKRDPKTLISWTSEERLKFRKISQGVWQDYSKKSPLCEKFYKSYTAWLNKIGLL